MKQVTLHGYPVEVGDRVWEWYNGWGTVERLDRTSEHPIRVRFVDGGYISYGEGGNRFSRHKQPELFWQPVKITPPPKPERKWIRVADLDTRYVVVGDELEEARLQQNHPRFVRWLTDRIEVKP